MQGATEVARAGATFLLFGFVRGDKASRTGPRGLAAEEIVERFGSGWEVLSEKPGGPMLGGVGIGCIVGDPAARLGFGLCECGRDLPTSGLDLPFGAAAGSMGGWLGQRSSDSRWRIWPWRSTSLD